MDEMVLTDPNTMPTEEIVFGHIGATSSLWQGLFEYIHSEHPALHEEWRYYKDGQSWLMKVTRKTKTVFWLSVIEGAFRITCYFTDKAEDMVFGSTLSDELKEQFRTGRRYNRIRGLTITFRDDDDISYAKAMIEIKLSLK